MQHNRWFRVFLGLCPVLVALLWIAGIARIRDFEPQPIEWGALVAVAFTLHILTRRARRRRPMPAIPEGSNPIALAGFAAAIVAVIVTLFGGLFEWFLEPMRPSQVALPLRALWHGACAFAGFYCSFLLRLQETARRPPTGNGDAS